MLRPMSARFQLLKDFFCVNANHNASERLLFRLSTVDCEPLLGLYVNTLPKRNVILNLRRSRLRRWIKPSRIVVPHPVHFQRVVVRGSLPRALRRVRTWLQKFLLYRIRREILIPFYNFRRVAFRNDLATPSRFRHSISPLFAQLPHVRSRFAAPVCHRCTAKPSITHSTALLLLWMLRGLI